MQSVSELFKKNIKNSERNIKGYAEVIYQNNSLHKTDAKVYRNHIEGIVKSYPIEIEDAVNYNLVENKVYGNSYQETRSGKNLFNINSEFRTRGSSDYINKTTNNGFYFEMPTYRRFDFYIDNEKNLTAGTYTISFDITENTSVNDIAAYFRTNTTNEKNIVIKGGFTGKYTSTLNLTSGTTNTIYMFLNSAEASGVKLNIQNIQLEKGSVATSYEPYGAMPSPDYPSEIKNVGVRNLLDLKKINNYSGCTYTISENSISVVNTGTWSRIHYKLDDLVIGSKYTILFDFINNNSSSIQCRIMNSEDSAIYIGGDVTTNKSGKYTLSFSANTNTHYIRIYTNTLSTIDTNNVIINNIQLEQGTTPHDYVPYGNWLVEKTRGKNLFDKDNDNIINGYINNSNGEIMTGGASNVIETFIKVTPKTTYYLTCNKVGRVAFYNSTKNYLSNISSGDRNMFTTPENTEYIRFQFEISGGSTKDSIMLEQGTTPTSYEPYKENKIIVSLNKENLFDINEVEENIFMDGNNGGTGTSSVTNTSGYIKIKGNTKYNISYDYTTLLNTNLRCIAYYDVNKSFISGYNASITEKQKTITTPANAVYFRFSYDKNITNIKIYEGTDPTPYYELNKIGNVQDELNIKTGVLTRRIGKVVLNGSENWVYSSSNKRFYITNVIPNLISISDTLRHIEYIVSDNFFNSTTDTNGGMFQYQQQLIVHNDNYTNVADFKTWLSNNNVTVYYVLAEPETIQLTKQELELFENYNYITVDGEVDPSDIEIKFIIEDSKSYENEDALFDNTRVSTNYGILNDNFTLDGNVTLLSKNDSKNTGMPYIIPYYYDFESNKFKYKDYSVDNVNIEIINNSLTAKGLTIYFENGYPYNFEIYSKGTLVEKITNNQKETYNYIGNIDIQKINLVINDWSEDKGLIRISEIDYGITNVYRNNSLIEFNIDEEFSLLNSEIPINECDITIPYNDNFNILNDKGVIPYLNDNAEINLYIGTLGNNGIEYVSCGKFYLNEWKNENNKKVTINGKTILNEIIKMDIPSITKRISNYFEYEQNNSEIFKSFIESIYLTVRNNTGKSLLTDFNLNSDYNQYFIPKKIKYNTSIKDILKNVSIMYMLNMYQKRNNTLYIGDFENDIKGKISSEELLEKVNIEFNNKINSVIFKYSVDLKENTTSNYLFTQDIMYSGDYKYYIIPTKPFVDYDNTTISLARTTAPSGTARFEILDKNDYFITMSILNRVMSSTNNKVVINGKSFNYTTNDLNYEYVSPNISSSKNTMYVNSYIDSQWTSHMQNVANNIMGKSPKYKADLEYNGDPSYEIGDLIEIETNNGYRNMRITRHRLKYDGSLSGSMEGAIYE